MALSVVVSAGVAVAAGPAVAAPTESLAAAVVDRMTERAPLPPGIGSRTPLPSPQVTVLRKGVGSGGSAWAMGSAVRPTAPGGSAYPEGWLFVARQTGKRWTVGLEGDPAFGRLSAEAPMLAADEKRAFAATVSMESAPRTGGMTPVALTTAGPSDRRTGMRLPFAVGQSWRLTGGPHPMSNSVRSSIDLAGGDGRVLAARAGRAYTMCRSGRGWVRVIHDRGFATDYYHLRGNIKANGVQVAEGAFLGNIGNDVSCGGSSTGAHVHFSLLRNGNYVEIDRYAFGKWSIRAAGGSYGGYALHGSRRVNVGGKLYNFGTLGFGQGIVDTDGGTVLNRRSGPGTNHPVVGTTPDGTTVWITCSAWGTTHTGRGPYTSNMWNRLRDGTWVSDVYLWTGTGNPVNGYC